MNHGLAVVLTTMIAAGLSATCQSKKGKTGRPLPDRATPEMLSQRELNADICNTIDLPANPNLALWNKKQRSVLLARLLKGPAAVLYRKSGCKVELDVLARCELTGRYNYRRHDKRVDRSIASLGALWNELPFGVAPLAEAFEDDEDFRLIQITSGRLDLDPELGIQRAGLSADTCAGATHVVVRADLGHLQVSSDENKNIDKAADAAACKDTSKLQPKGCRAPVRLELMRLSPTSTAAVSMLNVPAGRFLRGDKSQAITLSAFEIDRTEVSAAHYQVCVEAGKCPAPGTGTYCTGGVLGKEEHPINCIPWTAARDYCLFAGKRLPTDAEWERAARGVDGQKYVWGAAWPPPPGVGNFADEAEHLVHPYWRTLEGYDDGFAGTAPVDRFGAGESPVAALQMAGNVQEWVADWYAADYGRGAKDPKGPRWGKARVVRGSSFGHTYAVQLRVARRDWYAPVVQSMHVGVRCAR